MPLPGLGRTRSRRTHHKLPRRQFAAVESLEPRLPLTGTAMLVKDINPLGFSEPDDFVQLGDASYFTAFDPDHGRELWRTDGTEAGTVLVKDIYPGVYGAYPTGLTVWNDTLFFSASDGFSNIELWKSDGTTAGTQLVRDLNSNANYGSTPEQLTAISSGVLFTAQHPESGWELWKSDGTTDGTFMVQEINQNPYSGSYPRQLTAHNDLLYFVADDGVRGEELWKSDGTEAGTMLVKDIDESAYNSAYVYNLTSSGGTLYFSAFTVATGRELWKSDGTEAGTLMLRDIETDAGYGSYPSYLTDVNGTLYFAANQFASGTELWKSDGTEAGTVRVKDINQAAEEGSYPVSFVALGNTLIFSAYTPATGQELWRSDGTEAGTQLVEDIETTPGRGSYPYAGQAIGGYVYFQGTNDVHGSEAWRTDGTPSGTELIADIAPESAGSFPRNFTPLGSRVLFSADDLDSGEELWIYDPDFTPVEEPAFEFDFQVIASDLHPSFRFFGSPNPDHAPFQIIRFGEVQLTDISGFPNSAALIDEASDITIRFGSDDTNNPVSVLSLQEFDDGLRDGLANQIYRPGPGDQPQLTLSFAGTPVATGFLQEIALQTTTSSVVTSVRSRMQITAPAGGDTTVFDEIMNVTRGTGLIPFSLSAFNLVGPWIGVGDAELFVSTGSSGFDNVDQLATDFDDDSSSDLTDIDALSEAILTGTLDRRFDVNADGTVDRNDISAWLGLAGALNQPGNGAYLAADLNLDGTVDANDLGTWRENLFTTTNQWSQGDLNTDGVVDGRDFNIWNQWRFLSSPAASPAANTRTPRSPLGMSAATTVVPNSNVVTLVAVHQLDGQDGSSDKTGTDRPTNQDTATPRLPSAPTSHTLPPWQSATARTAWRSTVARRLADHDAADCSAKHPPEASGLFSPESLRSPSVDMLFAMPAKTWFA